MTRVFKEQVHSQRAVAADTLQHFALFDEIFQAFLDTNEHQGRSYDLNKLFAVVADDTKRYFRYSVKGKPYRATVRYSDGLCLDIKLVVDVEAILARRTSTAPRWVDLSVGSGIGYFANVLAATGSRFDRASCRCDHSAQRFDVTFVPPAGSSKCMLRLTFKPGYRFED